VAAELRVVGDKIAWKQTAGQVYELEGVDEGATAATNGQVRLHDGELWYTAAGRQRSVAGDAQPENVSAGIANGQIAVNGNRLLWKVGDVVYSALVEGAGREWSDFAAASEAESVSDESATTSDTVGDGDAAFPDDGWTAEGSPHPRQQWSDGALASEGESVSDESAVTGDTVADEDTAGAGDAWDAEKAAHPTQQWSDSASASESESISDESAVDNDTVSDGDIAGASDDGWSLDTESRDPTLSYTAALDIGFLTARGEFRAGDLCESVMVEYSVNGGSYSVLHASINTTPNGATTHQTDTVFGNDGDNICFRYTPYSGNSATGTAGAPVVKCVTLEGGFG
jgi:hypothetical protein